MNNVIGFSDQFHSNAAFDTFYSMPCNSVDVVALGGSDLQSGLFVSEAYSKEGIAIESMAVTALPFMYNQFLMNEAEKRQNPSVYVIDMRMLIGGQDRDGTYALSEATVRHVVDNMMPSVNHYKAVDYSIGELRKTYPDAVYDWLYYHFPLFMYHSKWKELSDLEFGVDNGAFMGAYVYGSIMLMDEAEVRAMHKASSVELACDSQQYLNETLDYCEKLKKEVLFINTPNRLSEVDNGRLNNAREQIERAGFTVLDFNEDSNPANIDYEGDFVDTMHLNYKGAIKFTDYLAEYLKKNYNLRSHWGDDKYKVYEETQLRLLDAIEQIELNN